MLEKIKTLYNPTPGMAPEKIGPTVGQNSKYHFLTRTQSDDLVGKINLPSTTLHFFDLGGQRDIRSIWPKYYDECHAVVFVLDACDQARLSEGWEVFGMCPSFSFYTANLSDEVLNSPRLLNLPLLLLANKQDSPTSLSVQEIRESFDAWTRAHPERRRAALESPNDEEVTEVDKKGKGKEVERADGWDNDGAVEERMASLDVLGVSALEG